MDGRLLLSTLIVTTTNDSGAGSLRQAILDSNRSATDTTIDFNIGTGPQTIIPLSPLPVVTSPVKIDGTTQPGYAGAPIIQINGSQIFDPGTNPPNTTRTLQVSGLVITGGNSTVRGLVINRFTGNGITILGGSRNVIAGNYIGTNLAGIDPQSNTDSGVGVIDSRYNTIGGTSASDRNVLSGNGVAGVAVTTISGQTQAGYNTIEGNDIGTDVSGSNNVGNGFDGVQILTDHNTVGGSGPGTPNVIAFNGTNGVLATRAYYTGQPINTTILSNAIFQNAGQGIALSYGTNNPVYSAALTSAFKTSLGFEVEGKFSGLPNTIFTVQFFSNPVADPTGAGQGQILVGMTSVSTDDTGTAQFAVTLPGSIGLNQSLSATATDSQGSTSQFFSNTQTVAGASSDLALTQYVSPSPGIAGGPQVFVLNVVNTGPSTATGVVLSDKLPAGVSVSGVQASVGTVTQSAGVITVAFGTLYSGAAATVQVTVIPIIPGPLENVVNVKGDQPDPKPNNNTSTFDEVVGISPFPATVTGVHLLVGLTQINGFVISVSEPLNPAQAMNQINYSLTSRGRKVATNSVVYDAASLTLTVIPKKPMKLGVPYIFTINGQGSAGLVDLAGNLLVGNTSAGPSGPFVASVSRGYVANPRRTGRGR